MANTAAAIRPRVLHVINDLDRGGAEMALCRLVIHPISQERLASTVICLKDEGPLATTLRDAGVEVHALGLRSLWNLPQAMWRLYRTMGRVAPDVVQTWLYYGDLLGGLVGCMRRVPVVWGVRTTSLGEGNAFTTRIVRWLCARLSSHVPAAIVYAADAARKAHECEGYRTRQTHVIRNGVQTQTQEALEAHRHTLRHQLGIESKELVIGWVGRYNPDKDVPTFLAALALLLRQQPKARAIMIGRGLGPEQSANVVQILGMQGASQMILMGERPQVQECYPAFDVFVLSSRTEAFPNVLAEAMSAGVPCVTTDVGDARWVLGDGGLVVPPCNPKAMAEAIQTMLSRPDQRSEYARLSRQRALSSHSMEAWAHAFADLYFSLLARR